jgi:hypothetical protein
LLGDPFQLLVGFVDRRFDPASQFSTEQSVTETESAHLHEPVIEKENPSAEELVIAKKIVSAEDIFDVSEVVTLAQDPENGALAQAPDMRSKLKAKGVMPYKLEKMISHKLACVSLSQCDQKFTSEQVGDYVSSSPVSYCSFTNGPIFISRIRRYLTSF